MDETGLLLPPVAFHKTPPMGVEGFVYPVHTFDCCFVAFDV